jgi:hypothetical protein
MVVRRTELTLKRRWEAVSGTRCPSDCFVHELRGAMKIEEASKEVGGKKAEGQRPCLKEAFIFKGQAEEPA